MIPIAMKFLGVLGLVLSNPSSSFGTELHDHAALKAAASALAGKHPEHVQLFTVGQSPAGREIVGLRLTASGEPPSAQPAILLVAGLDGARAYTSSLALEHASQLAAGYAQDEAVKQLLDNTTLYIIPRFDVDAGEARFMAPLAEVSGSGLGIDNDRDGRNGEDGPSDLNGDGFITWMRQLDPEGEWIEDPTDARALAKADPKKGERGKWKRLVEGLDSDGDEEVGEDPALDAVANRNFPRNWTEHDASAGRYPTSEPGSLALVEFLLQHKDIALVVTYGDESNLSHKPKSQDDKGASGGSVKTGVYESDLALLEELGDRYRKITSNEHEGLDEQAGSFQSFAYHHRGLLCLNIDPWSVPLDAKLPEPEAEFEDTDDDGDESKEEVAAEESAPDEDADKDDKPKPGDDAKRLIWLDQNVEQAFLPWTAFEHPQLGAVEIGGFLPYSLVEPPAQQLPELTEQHFEFLLGLGAYLPRLELREVEGQRLADGLLEITATLVNDAFLPQQVRAGERSRTIRPARVSLSLPMGAVLVGGASQSLVSDLERLGGRREFRWLVSGANEQAAIRIEVNTDNAGTARAKVEVK